jgi:hypothetical protein
LRCVLGLLITGSPSFGPAPRVAGQGAWHRLAAFG